MIKSRDQSRSFPACSGETPSAAEAIGLDVFYPIVPDAKWVSRIVPLGVRTIQIRLKDASAHVVRSNLEKALDICRAHDCQLIINDYWQEAIALKADFIHLGQEDLKTADIQAIKTHGLKLGISTHSEAELATALKVKPDYVALGPIYETKLKAMAWKPQGLARVARWKELLGMIPLVGIGGITVERAPLVVEAGACSVCAITDFINHKSPEKRIKEWLSWAKTVSRGVFSGNPH